MLDRCKTISMKLPFGVLACLLVTSVVNADGRVFVLNLRNSSGLQGFRDAERACASQHARLASAQELHHAVVECFFSPCTRGWLYGGSVGTTVCNIVGSAFKAVDVRTQNATEDAANLNAFCIKDRDVPCGDPPSFPNAHLQEHSGYEMGDELLYTCVPGYLMPSRHKAFSLLCDSCGEWYGLVEICVKDETEGHVDYEDTFPDSYGEVEHHNKKPAEAHGEVYEEIHVPVYPSQEPQETSFSVIVEKEHQDQREEHDADGEVTGRNAEGVERDEERPVEDFIGHPRWEQERREVVTTDAAPATQAPVSLLSQKHLFWFPSEAFQEQGPVSTNPVTQTTQRASGAQSEESKEQESQEGKDHHQHPAHTDDHDHEPDDGDQDADDQSDHNDRSHDDRDADEDSHHDDQDDPNSHQEEDDHDDHVEHYVPAQHDRRDHNEKHEDHDDHYDMGEHEDERDRVRYGSQEYDDRDDTYDEHESYEDHEDLTDDRDKDNQQQPDGSEEHPDHDDHDDDQREEHYDPEDDDIDHYPDHHDHHDHEHDDHDSYDDHDSHEEVDDGHQHVIFSIAKDDRHNITQTVTGEETTTDDTWLDGYPVVQVGAENGDSTTERPRGTVVRTTDKPKDVDIHGPVPYTNSPEIHESNTDPSLEQQGGVEEMLTITPATLQPSDSPAHPDTLDYDTQQAAPTRPWIGGPTEHPFLEQDPAPPMHDGDILTGGMEGHTVHDLPGETGERDEMEGELGEVMCTGENCTAPPPSSSSRGPTVAAIIAVVCMVAAAVFVGVWCYRRQRQKSSMYEMNGKGQSQSQSRQGQQIEMQQKV
ncbi:uncharacterized protein susd5 [Labrus bergylta]|uniref:uncharacterized protein susd5 n=1 Tax=Labrus bergylta TaxID=56723 RepID=UPI003313FF94